MDETFKTVSMTWRTAKVGPEDIDEPVICLTGSKKVIVFRDTWSMMNGRAMSNWSWLSSKYDIEWWTYQKEIII